MDKYKKLEQEYGSKLKKALGHLEYSYNKVLQLSVDAEKMDEESLETWESFAARFARVADIFLNKYLRVLVLQHDPGFNGSLLDFLHQAEKIGIVQNSDEWMSIREVRNIMAHEYSESDLSLFFQRIKNETPKLLAIKLN